MTERRSVLSKKAQRVLHVIAAVLLNLGIVFSAVYILFHLLEYYNPHTFIYPNLPWLPIAIPVLFILSVLLYDLLWIDGAFKKHGFRKARMWLIILCDFMLFAALSLTLYLKTCTNPLVEHNTIEEYQLPTPVATEAPTPLPATPIPEETAEATPSELPTPDPSDSASITPDPSESASPEPTETPDAAQGEGLLRGKYAEKFSDPPVEQTYDKKNVIETFSDGTEKALIYTYYGKNAAVEIYHYQKGKLEYQLAEIFVKDIACFRTSYSDSYHRNVKTQEYAQRINAILATNGDNFNSGKIEDGLIIRNGSQLYPGDGKRPVKYSRDMCVLYHDGTMRVYDCVLDQIDYDEILANYPQQVFYFGPKLLNDDGTARTKFNSMLSKINPRTVLGYYEPGHYGLVVVLGTREMIDYRGKNHGNGKSPGMTLTELSELCVQLGFTAAYNLDGGGSSGMVWNKTVFGHNDRTHADILAVVDP